MNRFISFLRDQIESYPFAFGFAFGFLGVWFALAILPITFENLAIAYMLILFLSIAIAANTLSRRIPAFIVIICLYTPIFVTLALILRGLSVYDFAETLIERSAIVAAIATFFVTSLKVAIDAWRAWKESIHTEEDLKLRREIFEFEKRNSEATDR